MRRKIVLQIIRDEIEKIKREPFYKEHRAAWMTVNALIDVSEKIRDYDSTLPNCIRETNRTMNGRAYFRDQPIGHIFQYGNCTYKKVSQNTALNVLLGIYTYFGTHAELEEAT